MFRLQMELNGVSGNIYHVKKKIPFNFTQKG
jgi:hypothetical protein